MFTSNVYVMELLYLPDSLLLEIVKYLNFGDLYSFSLTCERLANLCRDRSIARFTDVEGCYSVTDDSLKLYFQICASYVTILNLNHCYWISARVIQQIVGKCRNLSELHVIQCRLSAETLSASVVTLKHLAALSFSVVSYNDISRELFASSQGTLHCLKRLRLHYATSELGVIRYVGEQATLLDFCESLEELTIDSSEISLPELFRPVLENASKRDCLASMRLASTLHAGALMLFYGILAQLPTDRISWHSLLLPNVNLDEFARKSELKSCFSNVNQLYELDVSGSKSPFTQLDFSRTVALRYLNVAHRMLTWEQIDCIANSCLSLRSLNVFGCSNLFVLPSNDGSKPSAIMRLIEGCSQLRHLNVGGAHHHILCDDEFDRQATYQLKGLSSLSIPVCLLAEVSTASGKNERSASHGHAERRAKKPRLAPCTIGPELMKTIVLRNPHLSELEIIAVDFSSAFHKNKFIGLTMNSYQPCKNDVLVTDDVLSPISELRHLTSLILIGATGLNGTCLIKIARSCTNLRRLSLGHLGRVLTTGNIFANVAVHLKNVRDLRFEQPGMLLNTSFFDSLSHAVNLERLCIIAKLSTFQCNDVIRLTEQASRLIAVQLFTGATLTSCRSLTTALSRRFSKSRPAFNATVHPLLDDGIKDIPNRTEAKHFDELTRFYSRVCMQPQN